MKASQAGAEKLVIGLIGGIGSGKTFVARLLREMGGFVIEADKLGHEALRQPVVRQAIVERWGEQVLDERGEIARSRLAAIVFADARERQALEAMVHPYIERRIREEIARGQADLSARFVVLDAALLVEAGWHRLCDKIIFVEAPEALRQARSRQSRGWSAEEWLAREAAQWPLERKRPLAHAILVNTADADQLRHQLQALLRTWLGDNLSQHILPP